LWLKLASMYSILEIVAQEHKVFHEVGVVVLFEDGEQARDEVGAIEHHFSLASDQTVQEGVIVHILERIQSHQGEDQGQLMEVTSQRVDLALWLDEADELQTLGEVFHEVTKDLVCFFFLLLFDGGLLLVEPRALVSHSLARTIELLLLVKGSDIWIITCQEGVLCIFFDLNDVLEDALVHRLEAAGVLSTFNFGSKVDLADHQLSQELELANHHDTRCELSRDVRGLFGQRLVLLGSPWIQSLEVRTDGLIKLHERLAKLLVPLLALEPELLGNRSTTNDEPIISLELSCFTDDGIHDESVKPLQEGCAQMFMQKVYIPKSEYLLTCRVIPAAEIIQVHALAQTICDISKQSSHECEIMGIHGNECRHIVLVLVIEVSLILLVDQCSRLLLDGKVDDPGQLLSPNLLSW